MQWELLIGLKTLTRYGYVVKILGSLYVSLLKWLLSYLRLRGKKRTGIYLDVTLHSILMEYSNRWKQGNSLEEQICRTAHGWKLHEAMVGLFTNL
jgi:hypothetical protein